MKMAILFSQKLFYLIEVLAVIIIANIALIEI
jgi:hypothetical protein